MNIVKLDIGIAKKQLDEMNTKVTMMGVKSIIWYFNKTMRKALQGLHVDLPSVERVKTLLS